MVVKEEQERVKTLISDTVTLLCRNGLSYKTKFCINALIGITLDEDEILLLDIRETVKSLGAEDSAGEDSGDASNQTAKSPSSRKRRKHRRQNKTNHDNYQSDSGSEGAGSGEEDNNVEPPHKRLVKEEGDDEDSDDLVFIKDEPADNSNLPMTSFGNALYQQQHTQQQQQSGDILSSLAQQGQLYATPASDALSGGPSQWDPTSSQVPFSQSSLTSPSGQLNMSAAASLGADASQEQCRECGKWFSHRGNLRRHERQHRGIYTYPCSHCPRGFSNRDNLYDHMTSVHGADHSAPCPRCHRVFKYRKVLKPHLKSCRGAPAGGV